MSHLLCMYGKVDFLMYGNWDPAAILFIGNEGFSVRQFLVSKKILILHDPKSNRAKGNLCTIYLQYLHDFIMTRYTDVVISLVLIFVVFS